MLDCLNWKNKVNTTNAGEEFPGDAITEGGLCGSDETLCHDGSCMPDSPYTAKGHLCPIIPRCPLGQFRTSSGTCSATKETVKKCAAGFKRCEDGACRKTCLHYDGCPVSKPFHCPTRECASSLGDCQRVKSEGQPLWSRRLLAADAPEPTACHTNCMSEIKPVTLQYTADSARSAKFAMAVHPTKNTPVAWLEVPSGAMVGNSSKPTIQIRPVADSIMRWAENAVHPSRVSDFTDHMTYVESLLSPAFECSVDDTVQTPFRLSLVFEATIDSTREPQTQNQGDQNPDVCLAYLYRIPSLSYARWACIPFDHAERRDNPPVADFAPDKYLLKSSVPDCGSAYEGKVYGFVHSPISVTITSNNNELTWAQRNKLGVVMIILSLIIVVLLGLFTLKRFMRYRKKYHEEREAVNKIKDEHEEMEQFGGQAGQKDDEMEMVSNPLVVQMKDMQRRLDEKSQQMAREEQAQLQQESAQRKEVIASLQTDRDDLAAELARLQAELASQQAVPQARPQMEDVAPVAAAPVAATQVAQQQKQTTFTSARPKKKKQF
jgi:hypothetical protein